VQSITQAGRGNGPGEEERFVLARPDHDVSQRGWIRRRRFRAKAGAVAVITIVVGAAAIAFASTPSRAADVRNRDNLSGSIGFVYGSFAPQSQWENYFKGFNKLHPNVKINFIPVPLDDWGSYAQKIATLIAGGQKVDVIWIATEGVSPLASRGVLAPLGSYLRQDKNSPELKNYLGDVSPALLKALQYQGKQYELPFAWNDEEIWYNPALFAAAHLAPPSANWRKSWTWSQYLHDAQALTKDTNGDGTPDVYGTYVDTGWFSLEAFLYSNGTSLLTPDLKHAQVTNPKVEQTIQFLHDLVWKYHVAPQPSTSNVNDLFMGGKIAMFNAGRWPLQAFKPAKYTNYQVAPLPYKAAPATVLGSDGYGITAHSSNKAAAWALVRYMTSTQVMGALVNASAASSSIPARRSLATKPAMAPPSNYKTFYGALDVAKPVQAGIHYPDLVSIETRYMSKVMANEMSVPAAAAAMQKEMTGALNQ
jgi:multiple sugar transport system substrate-binding protein